MELGSVVELAFLPALNSEMENSHSPCSPDAWFFTHSRMEACTPLPLVKKCPEVGACVGKGTEGLGVLAPQDTTTEEWMTKQARPYWLPEPCGPVT